MASKNIKTRQNKIVELVNSQKKVSVEYLSQQFNTSVVTIRKDLSTLEKSGKLLRQHGGAISISFERTSSEADKNSEYKELIANLAATLIEDNNRIIVDYGTTTGFLVQSFENINGLVVMTNSIHLANKINMLKNQPTLLMTGGTWDNHSESLQGRVAEQVLKSYDFDQLFIGCDGIDLSKGTTTYNELFGLSHVMSEVSKEIIVLAESEKIERKIPNIELVWDQIDYLITDENISESQKQAIKKHNVKVMCASKSVNTGE